MARVKGGVHAKKKHRAVLERAKGFRGARSRRFRVAKEAVFHAERYAYRDRRRRKGDFRKLWITRINAAARIDGLSYSRFMHGLKLAEVTVDRKNLADLAVREPDAFSALVTLAKDALGLDTGNGSAPAAAEEPAAADAGASGGVADATPDQQAEPADATPEPDASAEHDTPDEADASAEDDTSDEADASAEDDTSDEADASAEDDTSDEADASAEDNSSDEAEAADEPYGEGSARSDEDGAGPEGWTIKGNADSMLYHTEESPYFGRTKAEVWFETEEAAEEAGFTRWDADK